MVPLFREQHFTFRFADDRIIPRFHLEGIEAGRLISVFWWNPVTEERQGLIASVTVGEGGWVDLPEPIKVRAGDQFIAAPEAQHDRSSQSNVSRVFHRGEPRDRDG